MRGVQQEKLEASQHSEVESGVPLSMLQEEEANERGEMVVEISLEFTGNNPPVPSNDASYLVTTSSSNRFSGRLLRLYQTSFHWAPRPDSLRQGLRKEASSPGLLTDPALLLLVANHNYTSLRLLYLSLFTSVR
ncbi:unnamed protein product [Dibothriocephalus latus]|uniref:Uncharacterized protein n=1 Tax=Dibothriocephalus latus TaxID=60516 RepID=A0A3P7P7B3_DIBLA|nr:unnamed protein product [Dibothriocephalus latus]